MKERLIREIAAVVGTEHLLTSPEDCWTYGYDATDQARAPEAVVFPGTAAEISQILRLANEQRFAVTPRGAGTGRSGGAIFFRYRHHRSANLPAQVIVGKSIRVQNGIWKIEF